MHQVAIQPIAALLLPHCQWLQCNQCSRSTRLVPPGVRLRVLYWHCHGPQGPRALHGALLQACARAGIFRCCAHSVAVLIALPGRWQGQM
jgi:hypothetical protein